MKYLLLSIFLMSTLATTAQNRRSTTVKKTFSRQTSISIDIEADKSIVWALLTNASDYPRWNSTVVSIDGTIAKDEKIKLKSVLDDKRTFKLIIKEFEPEKRMVWGDGKGNRTYIIQKTHSGVTFSMTEKIGGFFYPMYAGYIPPFDDMFEQFAADLKKESEIISKSN